MARRRNPARATRDRRNPEMKKLLKIAELKP
jgi:hypothetical protein